MAAVAAVCRLGHHQLSVGQRILPPRRNSAPLLWWAHYALAIFHLQGGGAYGLSTNIPNSNLGL